MCACVEYLVFLGEEKINFRVLVQRVTNLRLVQNMGNIWKPLQKSTGQLWEAQQAVNIVTCRVAALLQNSEKKTSSSQFTKL